ncbi:MAG: acyl carrier protein [Chloroflexi bacterium]|nr:acyl carrier protein [Chloroflexota bacterium]
MATVHERVIKVAAERLGVEASKIKAETSYTDDLNADSLDLVELIMALEEEFGDGGKPLEITDEEAEGIRTIQDTVAFLKSRGIADT